jgi:hypothetical protein
MCSTTIKKETFLKEEEFKSPIEGVIQEEYQRQNKLADLYKKELSEFPKGTLTFQKRKNQVYAYLKYRDGKKVVNKYIGPKESEAVEKMRVIILERKKTETFLKDVKKNIKRMEKVFRATN